MHIPVPSRILLAVVVAALAKEAHENRAALSTITLSSLLARVPFGALFAPTVEQALIWPVFLAWLWALTLAVPGYVHAGAPLSDGSVVRWRINGIWCFVLTVLGFAAGVRYDLWRGSIIADNVGVLFLQANVIALAISAFLFFKGRAAGETSGDAVYDLVAGPELNPYVFGVPVKFFFLKPAMIGWAMVNISFWYLQASSGNHIVGTPMVVYQIMVLFYVFDYFYVEENMTSTWDIVAEHYGLMLVWGHLVFMPFVFSLQCYWLIDMRWSLPLHHVFGMGLLMAIGYYIFRTCNNQKHQFKHHPSWPIDGKPPVVIGGRLLASGFWGMARHVNYLGDLIIAVAFALPCGFSTVLPWAYPIYLTLLLVHREYRDDVRCAEKYKAVWDEYCALVPYHIIPYVY